MPDWLTWLLPVPVATLLAVLWTAWTGRRRGPVDPVDSVQAHRRFVAALESPRGAASRRGARRRGPGTGARDGRSAGRSRGRPT